MGPSILAAAFTTICSAVVMIFTTITFFQKFAMILFFTILMATIGSFVVFITLADCIAPSRPTYLMDLLYAKMTKCCCCKRCKKDEELEKTRRSSAAAATVVDGRRSSLYSDLDSLKQDREDQSSVVEGRRESLYSDLVSLRDSTNAGESGRFSVTDSVIDGRRASLYSDLEGL